MQHYFEATPIDTWRIEDIYEGIKSLYPDRQRSYHVLLTKKELESITKHQKASFRKRAQYLLDNFKAPYSNAETNRLCSQTARTIINNAKSQSFLQATHLSITSAAQENTGKHVNENNEQIDEETEEQNKEEIGEDEEEIDKDEEGISLNLRSVAPRRKVDAKVFRENVFKLGYKLVSHIKDLFNDIVLTATKVQGDYYYARCCNVK